MKRFKSAGPAPCLLSVHNQVANYFRRPVNISAADHRKSQAWAFATWAEVAGLAAGF
jgi:putative transposase